MNYKDTIKYCESCGKELVLNNNRDIDRKRFCSMGCKSKVIRESIEFEESTCKQCGIIFVPVQYGQIFCSQRCSSIYHRKDTKHQYDIISGDWSKYFARLCNKKERAALNKNILLSLLEKQNYRCAISGVKLTCNLINGSISLTNASIDRIEAGGPYIEENIQLVCRAVNTMKWTMTKEELLWWCKKIIEIQED